MFIENKINKDELKMRFIYEFFNGFLVDDDSS